MLMTQVANYCRSSSHRFCLLSEITLMPRPNPLFLSGLDGMLTKIKSNMYALHNLDLPPRFKRRQLIIIISHGGGGDSKKFKKEVEVWCRGWYFYLIFSTFITFKFRNYFIHCKVVLYLVLCSTITSWKKVIGSGLKMNLKISHIN